MKVIHVFRWNPAIRYLWEKVKFFCLLFCCILKKVAKFCFYRKRKRIGTKTNFVILVLDTIVWMTLTEISLHVNFLHKRTLYLIYSFYPTTHFTPPYPNDHMQWASRVYAYRFLHCKFTLFEFKKVKSCYIMNSLHKHQPIYT